MDPNYYPAQSYLGLTYAANGQLDEAYYLAHLKVLLLGDPLRSDPQA